MDEDQLSSSTERTRSDVGGFQLVRRQQTLVSVLDDRNPDATAIYVGALRVLADSSNPDRLALGAHAIRELMNLIPRYFELPIEEKDDSLGNKVHALSDAWRQEQSRSRPPGDPFSAKFVGQLAAFFAWHVRHHPKQREFAATLLAYLDPSKRALPPPIEELRVAEWRAMRDFFVGAAHHKACEQAELETWLESLETFLLNLVKPRFFENADELDALIAEAENG